MLPLPPATILRPSDRRRPDSTLTQRAVNSEPTAADNQRDRAGPTEAGRAAQGAGARDRRSRHYVRFSAARLTVMAALLALALVRVGLNPPVSRAVWVLLPGWFLVAAVYHLLQPRQEMPYGFVYLLRLSFYAYEVSTVLLVANLIGASGWLAILFLLLPTLELNLAFPDRGGTIASFVAALAVAAVAYAEARGRLWHDPFYSVDAPLYREPAYLAAVLILAIVFLAVLPRWVARYVEARS